MEKMKIISPIEFDEIVTKIENGEMVRCMICNNPLTKQDLLPNEIICRNEHSFSTYSYVPKFEEKNEVLNSLWLNSDESFSFDQLSLIRDLLNLPNLNLVELKKKLNQNKSYLIIENKPLSIIEEKIKELKKLGIKFTIK